MNYLLLVIDHLSPKLLKRDYINSISLLTSYSLVTALAMLATTSSFCQWHTLKSDKSDQGLSVKKGRSGS
jgi:hypothetical protein